jgi:NTE family protein
MRLGFFSKVAGGVGCWTALLLTTACAHFPLNERLAVFEPEAGYRYRSETPSDEILLVLSFSGGGTRAAAFAFGVLEALRDSSLLEEVDVVASVSGGSILAAYYALFGERTFDEFPAVFLEKDVQGALARRLASPRNWFRLLSRNYDRIDLVADYFDEHLFNHATFADIVSSRPFLLISATDITRGVPFEFTQDHFDLLCADLESYPIARAVAASTAVPVALTPITLVNYGWPACSYREPFWIEAAARKGGSSRYARRVRARRSYRDPEKRAFVHLLDGGLADNLGLQGLLEGFFSTDTPCEGQALGLGSRRLVVVVVNAVTDLDRSAELKKQGPSLAQTIWAAANIPIDQHSFVEIETLTGELEEWVRHVEDCGLHAGAERRSANPDDIYTIVVDFEAVRKIDPAASQRLRRIPTNFDLEPGLTDELRQAGARALIGSSEFQRLLRAREPGQD